MAEQEAVAQVISSAMDDRSHGESLLLPLLQELLDKKSQNNQSQVLQRSASSQSSEESAPTVDSGTESGEELRFLAANFGDGIEPLGPGLLAEVQGALSKLALSLQMDRNEMESEKRNSLLQLVARLQSSLVVAKPERRASAGGRFQKKNRQNRHTVGVSSEELAAARKLMEEVVLRDSFNPEYKLEKQNSDTSVTSKNSNQSYKSINSSTPVKNNTAKPFTQQYSISEPPTPPITFRDNSSKTSTRQSSLNLDEIDKTMLEYIPNTYNHNQVENWVQNPSAQIQNSKTPEFIIQESDDDTSTVKPSDTPTNIQYLADVKTMSRTITPVDTIHENSVYYNDMSAAQRLLNIAMNDDSKTNRFNTKKLKMKRANTIDIPKPLNFYENDDDSDDNLLERDEPSTRRSNYLALRGPIRVGPSQKSTVPSFEPKTENDKKFMAFIQKHNNNSSVSSIWANKQTEPVKKTDHNWNRKFGNIKTIFEKDEQTSRPPSTTNAAKQFWQSADDAVNAGKRSYIGPKVSKQGTRQLQSLFEQKQQENKLPWTATEQNNVVTGNLKLESSFKPIQNNNLNYKFVPQPLPVNKFDHAPMSAFKPPPKRTPLQTQSFSYPHKQPIKPENTSEPTTPLYLYTPKQPEFPEQIPNKTWISPTTEHRVLSIAASKFENSTASSQSIRKPSKDKVYIPPILTQENKELNSPYLVKNVPTKTVRKLSGEYDHNWTNNKIENVVTYRQPIGNNTAKDKIQIVKQNVQKYEQKPQKDDFDRPKVKQNSYEQQKSSYYPQGYAQNNKTFNNNVKSYNQPSSFAYPDTYNNYPPETYHPDNQKPSKPHLIFDFPSSESSASRSVSTTATPDNLDDLEITVTSPLTEYKAVAKVMTGPVSQQAVTVSQNTPKKREEHDLAARNLTSMLKFSMTEGKSDKKPEETKKISPKVSQESLEINDDGESIVTTKLQIPVNRNVYYNNTDPSKIQKRITMDEIEQINKRLSPTPSKSPQTIHKSDSWHKLTETPSPNNKPSPRASPKARNILQKAKSSHTLAVPQYQAGIAKEEVETKKKTIAAYFAPQQSIIRKKTSEKLSTQTKTTGLSRSRTMPDVADLDPLDIDKEFENIFRQSISK